MKLSIGADKKRHRSEVDDLGGVDMDDDDPNGRRSSRRRAAKNLAKNAYTLDLDEMEYADSPASSSHSKEAPPTGIKDKKKGKRTRGRKKKESGAPSKTEKGELRVPPMKIKMIGRSGESDSPIFFAESLESWDEGSGSERGMAISAKQRARLKDRGLDSETSSLMLEEREEDVSEVSWWLTHTHKHQTYTYTQSHIQTYTQSHIHSVTHTLSHTYKHTLSHTYTQSHIHSVTHTNIHSVTHTNIHSVTHTLSHTYKHTLSHTYKHTLSHTYTQSHIQTYTQSHIHTHTAK